AIREAMRGITDKEQRKRVRRMLLAGRQTGLTAEQRALSKQLTMLEARTEMVKRGLKTVAQAPYFHLGRFGDFIVGLTVRKNAEGDVDPDAMQQVADRLGSEFPNVSLRADADSPVIFTRFESAEGAE